MDLIVSFSGRENGNCDEIAAYVSSGNGKIVCFRDLNVHACAGCRYECFAGACRYRGDDIYGLYTSMLGYDRVILLVPMYGGNPSSLYFVFCERAQDFFMHNDVYGEIVRRLYIIGVYGSAEESPDFVPGLEKWFAGTPCRGRVLGIERHRYGQKMGDRVLDAEEVKERIANFLT